ncbi:hypothetical protein QAD02_021246 [Eretmocerus hayati]|uniref:Uncharacterized protein n=1 Tax=Eretmocerus hayati TaxID=131215 RepID=A0ACC2PR11_9HYME|nr:hypothetical protein QAD02_021246 [Eretmocerus hayati]
MVPDEVILEQMKPPLIPKVMLEPLGQTKKPRRRDCRNSESSDKSELGRRDYVKEMSKRLNKKNYMILDEEKEDLNSPEDDNFNNDYENFEAVEMDGDVIVNGNSDRKAPESRDLRESGEEGEMKKKKKKKGTKKENDDVEQDEEQIEDARNNLIPSKKRKNMGIVEGSEVEEEEKKKKKKKEKRDAMGYDHSTLQNTQEVLDEQDELIPSRQQKNAGIEESSEKTGECSKLGGEKKGKKKRLKEKEEKDKEEYDPISEDGGKIQDDQDSSIPNRQRNGTETKENFKEIGEEEIRNEEHNPIRSMERRCKENHDERTRPAKNKEKAKPTCELSDTVIKGLTWSNLSIGVCELLDNLFDKKTLRRSSPKGVICNANPKRRPRPRLDPEKMEYIYSEVGKKYGYHKTIRTRINKAVSSKIGTLRTARKREKAAARAAK